MPVGFQPGAVLNTQAFANRPENLEVPFMADRAPTATDINYPVGKQWVFVGDSVYQLLSFSTVGGIRTANWIQLASGSGNIVSVSGTANQITAATVAGATTLSIPATFTAPGSITATTSLNAAKVNVTAGANASVGTSAAMTAGTIVVNTTAVTASSIIFVSINTIGGTAGAVSAPAASRVAGTSFTITSSSNTDTSTINWWIIN